MTNNQPPELLSDKELRQLSELFWRFHNDRLDDPTIKEMKPYIQPILDLINQQKQAYADDIRKWVEYNKHDFGEMGEFIRTQYVYNKLATLEAQQDKEGNDEL